MRILNFGSLNIDYTYSVEHFVRGGETISSAGLQTFSGGKGLNQSIALGRSGAEVWHAGAVGESDGNFLVEQLEEAGVHTEYVAHTDTKTGHAIIQRTQAGENCIILYGGANQRITREMADQVLEHFGEGDFLVLQNEISEIGYIMDQAHKKQMRIVFNPSPMDQKIFRYPLSCVDCFLMNEVEAADLYAELCGEPEADQPQGQEEDLENGTEERMIRSLAKLFPEASLVVTLGARGSLCWDGKKLYRQGIYPVDTVDTTAAGDTFTGYYIGSLAQGGSVAEALDMAAKAAAMAAAREGAAPSIPAKEDVDAWRK